MTELVASFTDVYSSALRGEACRVVGLSVAPRPLPVSTWNQSADPGDLAVLAQCVGPTLDIGCGPGRMTQHLAERGHAVLGIDVVPEAVFQTRDRGVAAMLRNVFEPLPGEGRWGTALLADGNIGIGGDPKALLIRSAELLQPGGRVVVDLAAPGTGLETRTIRLETRSRYSRPFQWSVVGVDAIGMLAAGAGLVVERLHQHGDRWFAVLHKEA
jgi:SAM-dependent methyltransferase